MSDIYLKNFFAGEEDRCERLVAALQYVLKCVSGSEIASRDDLAQVQPKAE
jgi:hypothetical protein